MLSAPRSLRAVARSSTTLPFLHKSGVRTFSGELAALKARIETIKSTSKVCQAMQSIAAAKITQAEIAAKSYRPYWASMEPIFKSDTDHDDKVKKVLVVPISSNRGMCGSVNTQLRRHIKKYIDDLDAKNVEYRFFFIGDRLRRAFHASHGNRIVNDGSIGKLDDLRFVPYQVSCEIVDKFITTKEFDKLVIWYNFYVSKTTYVPFSIEYYSRDIAMNDIEHLSHYEMEDEDHLDSLYSLGLATHLHGAIVEHQASEQASRMLAMDNASKNCEEMVDEMTRAFNIARQAQITAEIGELVNGAAAVMEQFE